MSLIEQTLTWLSDPSQWSGPGGIPWRTAQHLGYTALAVAVAALIAVPVGIFIGHTGRFRAVAILSTGALRALPTLGLLTLIALSAGIGLTAPITALAVLCIPPLLAGIYSGIESVDNATVDAARAQGMTELQIVARVELPLAMPLIIGGLRSAVLQVIATATVAAFIGAGGLGRYIIDGLAVNDTPRVLGGALVVVLLALVIDALFAAAQKISARRAAPAAQSGPRTHHLPAVLTRTTSQETPS